MSPWEVKQNLRDVLQDAASASHTTTFGWTDIRADNGRNTGLLVNGVRLVATIRAKQMESNKRKHGERTRPSQARYRAKQQSYICITRVAYFAGPSLGYCAMTDCM
jgi:hypothetical protein